MKWKRTDLCKQAIQRFKDDLSLYVSPSVMSQIINIIAWYEPLDGPPGVIYFSLRLTLRAGGSKRPIDIDVDGLDSGWLWEETSTDDEIPPPKQRPEPLPFKKRRID